MLLVLLFYDADRGSRKNNEYLDAVSMASANTGIR